MKLKSEIQTLQSEKAELREMNDQLKQTLDKTVRGCAKHRELQRQLMEARKEMSSLRDRLTLSEQVTAATQRRQLVQEGVYENLPTTGAYMKLRLDPTQIENFYTASPGCNCIIVFRTDRMRETYSVFTLITMVLI